MIIGIVAAVLGLLLAIFIGRWWMGRERASLKRLCIELSQVEFVDSAALGILLLARDEAEKSSTKLVLKSPQGQVKRMFEISKFHDLFNIED